MREDIIASWSAAFLENSLSNLCWKLCVKKTQSSYFFFSDVLSNVVYKYDQSSEHAISLQVLRE